MVNLTQPDSRKRILVVVAVPMTVKAFLLNYLRALGTVHEVTVVCADGDAGFAESLPPGVSFIPVDIRRAIAPMGDLKALLALVRIMRSGQFAMLHSVTPKAGLLAQLAARYCGINIRVHTFTGQVWVTKHGVFRWILKAMDRLIALCATRLLADSASQRQFLIDEGVVSEEKIEVLGSGSISGVDAERFRPDPVARRAVRSRLGYSDGDVLALFVGRLNRDKGVLDLVEAFVRVSAQLPQLALLLVGPDEEGLAPRIEQIAQGNSRLHLLGGTAKPEEFMAAADFFCLPSYREGFGSVVIEAAACAKPAIASAIYGLTDAVEDGKSGALHPPSDVSAIADLLVRFTLDNELRDRMGQRAHQRALTDFSAESVVRAQMGFVGRLFAAADLSG